MATILTPPDKIEQALQLFKTGHSLRECEKITEVGYKRIEREAKARGIVKGELSQLLEDSVKVAAATVTLCDKDREFLSHAVTERTKHLTFFNKAGMILASTAVKRVQAEPNMSMQDVRHASEVVAKQRDGILGKQPDTQFNVQNNQSFSLKDLPANIRSMSEERLAEIRGLLDEP